MAGLKAGDVLVEANGQKVDADHPISEVIQAGQGAPVTIKVLRDGQQMIFTVTPDKNAGAYQVGIQIGPYGDAHAGVVRDRRQGGARLSRTTRRSTS